MKRLHVHVTVGDIEQSTRFYSTLFASEPTVRKADYAKWMLHDPRVNFAISARGASTGIDHLGMQVDDAQELDGLRHRLESAEGGILTQSGTHCCYARSDKHWITDPQGIAWETFHTLDSIPRFNDADPSESAEASACCAPGTTA